MKFENRNRPLGSYLLRVFEERVERVQLRYELLDLASGTPLHFATLAALQRHLRERGAREQVGLKE